MEAQITISPAIAAGSFNFAVFMDFIARLTDALAWPTAVAIIAFSLRPHVAGLKLKAIRGAGIEAEFGELQDANRNVAAATPPTAEIQEFLREPASDKNDDRGRVVRKFVQVDKALERLANTLEPEAGRGAGRAQHIGRGLLEPAQMEIYKNLRLLRNRAASAEQFDVSTERIQQYERVADQLIESIDSLGSGT